MAFVAVGLRRRLLRRNNDSKDPITGEIISEDDLVDVKTCMSILRARYLSPLPVHAVALRYPLQNDEQTQNNFGLEG